MTRGSCANGGRSCVRQSRGRRRVFDPHERSCVTHLLLNCTRCLEYIWRNCRKRVSAGVLPGSHAGREARAVEMSLNGRGATRPRKNTRDASSMSQKLQAGKARSDVLTRIVVAIERHSDALKRHEDILCEGRSESAATAKETKTTLESRQEASKFLTLVFKRLISQHPHFGLMFRCWFVSGRFALFHRWYGPSLEGT